jgi:hypothetical protein
VEEPPAVTKEATVEVAAVAAVASAAVDRMEVEEEPEATTILPTPMQEPGDREVFMAAEEAPGIDPMWPLQEDPAARADYTEVPAVAEEVTPRLLYPGSPGPTQ